MDQIAIRLASAQTFAKPARMDIKDTTVTFHARLDSTDLHAATDTHVVPSAFQTHVSQRASARLVLKGTLATTARSSAPLDLEDITAKHTTRAALIALKTLALASILARHARMDGKGPIAVTLVPRDSTAPDAPLLTHGSPSLVKLSTPMETLYQRSVSTSPSEPTAT